MGEAGKRLNLFLTFYFRVPSTVLSEDAASVDPFTGRPGFPLLMWQCTPALPAVAICPVQPPAALAPLVSLNEPVYLRLQTKGSRSPRA